MAGVYSHRVGGDKGRLEPAAPFQVLFGGGDHTLSPGSGGSWGFKPIGVLGASGQRERWRSFGTSCLSSPLPPLPPRTPAPGAPLSNREAQVESWGGRADEGQAVGAGRGGQGLPLVGGGLPGPGQPCAPHRLVPERAVLIDAAHSSRAAARRTRGTARGLARRTRRDPRFPATDPGRARPARRSRWT